MWPFAKLLLTLVVPVVEACVVDSVGICCLWSGVKFVAHNTLCGGHAIPNSQPAISCDSVASTHTGLIRTDCYHGTNTLILDINHPS